MIVMVPTSLFAVVLRKVELPSKVLWLLVLSDGVLVWSTPEFNTGSPPCLKKLRAALEAIRWSVPIGLQARMRAVAHP